MNFEIDKNFDIAKIPNGVWMQQEDGIVLLGATTKNHKTAIALLAFILLVVFAALEEGQNTAYNVVHFIVGAFFMLFTFPLWAIVLMAIGGKVEVTLDDEKCKVFKGFWKFGSTTIVDLNTISIEKKKDKKGSHDICLNSKNKEILSRRGMFSWLEWQRVVYLMSAIAKILQDKNSFLQEDLSEHLI